MDSSDQILSIWVGPQSQRYAHYFYSLQAQQFFDEQGEPTRHKSMWNFHKNEQDTKCPNMLIYDSHIPRLVQLRQINLAKMIKKIEQTGNEFSFKIEHKQSQGVVEKEDNDDYLFENWLSQESYYVLIQTDFNMEVDSYEFWEERYQQKRDDFEDPVRKKLESSDYLQLFFMTADDLRVGFTLKMVQYLKDQCPKKEIIYNDVQTNAKSGPICFIPNIAEVSSQVDMYCSIGTPPRYSSFKNSNVYGEYAPIFNSLLTPFTLKDVSQKVYQSRNHDFLPRIVTGGRNIFNVAYTLPIISEQLQLSESTNIFKYIPQLRNRNDKEYEAVTNRINFTNQTYLSLHPRGFDLAKKQSQGNYGPAHLLAESYVLKGHVHDLESRFIPKTELLSMRYLQGIIANNPRNHAEYSSIYEKQYGNIVQNYPFHTVTFQHRSFGAGLRSVINDKKIKIAHQMNQEWKQQILAIADMYLQVSGDSD